MPDRANGVVHFFAEDIHKSFNVFLFPSVACELASSCMPCAGVVQSIVFRLLVAGVVYLLVLDRKALENDIIVRLILSRLPRFLKKLGKAAARIKCKWCRYAVVFCLHFQFALESWTGRPKAYGLVLPRVITKEKVHWGQMHSESKRGSPQSRYNRARGHGSVHWSTLVESGLHLKATRFRQKKTPNERLHSIFGQFLLPSSKCSLWNRCTAL